MAFSSYRLNHLASACRRQDIQDDTGPQTDLIGDDLLLPGERQVLLEEIALIGLVLGKDLALPPPAGVPLSPTIPSHRDVSPLERLNLLLTLWPDFEAALMRMALHPERTLRPVTLSVPFTQARGGYESARSVIRAADRAAAWTSIDHPHVRQSNERSSRPFLHDRRLCASRDTVEHRFIGEVLRELEQEAGILAALAAYCGERDWTARAQSLQAEVACWRRHALFSTLPPLTGYERTIFLRTGAGLRSAPPYRAFYANWRALQRALQFDWSNSPLLRLPTLDGWHLYEIWCFLTVAATLRGLGWHARESSIVYTTSRGLHLGLATGQASRLVFTRAPSHQGSRRTSGAAHRLSLYYQPLYTSANQRSQHPSPSERHERSRDRTVGYCSLSHAMQPDIVLEWQQRLYILDAKYRRYSPADAAQEGHDALTRSSPLSYRTDGALLDDVDKMHAYRDAIVRNGRSAVHAAWCLFPGERDAQAGIIAYPHSVPDRPFGTAGVGAVRLRPGAENQTLQQLLTLWLSCSASPGI